ncbi:MAG: DUF938 domain-containing protein [Microcystaceae cyanobacterium]
MRNYAPATQRNRQPILEVLQSTLPATGNILEIASGTGEHAVFFAPFFSSRQWFPSDVNPISCQSIEAWRQHSSVENVQSSCIINVLNHQWWQEINIPNLTTIININMIHISPWQATVGLMEGASYLLPQDGILYLYGPYQQEGKHTAPSNESFDQSLQAQNPEWGVRHLEEVIELADKNQLLWQQTVKMPANNLSVIFKKKSR